MESYSLGTVTKTRAPGGSGFIPAELTTSGMEDHEGATRWRAAAWQLFAFRFDLFRVDTMLPFPICFHGDMCGEVYAGLRSTPPSPQAQGPGHRIGGRSVPESTTRDRDH